MSENGSDIVARFALGLLEEQSASGVSAPLVLGLCGAQGVGKSTVARTVAEFLEGRGWRVLLLSLDDLYFTRAERERLAREVHPLFATRGVPGTHDVALGLRVLEGAARQGRVAVPRFDKSRDDRAPREKWPVMETPVDLVLFEGWCVGAVPQTEDALAVPVNELERCEDTDGKWRRHANAQLSGPYRALFDRLDALVLLAAPGFEVVAGWRKQQELGLEGGPAMTPDAIDRFVRHYERLTRHILAEMPGRADLVIRLDGERRVISQATRSRGDPPSK
jgi:D-glycerate 3-kinase